MNTTPSYKIVGIVMLVLFVGTTYVGVRQRIRDKKTGVLLTKINALIGTNNTKLSAEKAFDLDFLNTVLGQSTKQVVVLKNQVATSIAKEIYSAWGSWYQGGDDEAKVYGVFRKLKDKIQVSQVAKAYQSAYGENLIDVLKNRFSTTEINQVLQIIKHLPNYRTRG